MPEEVVARINHSLVDNENYSYPFQFGFGEPSLNYPVEGQVKLEERKTKPRETRESKQEKDEFDAFEINF
jgi:hypothetical protein